MNKTININLGGIFFHIDEEAYAKLKRYLDAINQSLNDDPQGKEEIISDIEQRISELLSEKIANERQVINELNIDEVIAVMGQPEDYAYDDELFTETNTSDNKTSKKLYRDGKDKFLGGVSSGLGYYFGIDTAWVRIIWIAIAFFFGTGVIVYFILWIILPEANTTAEELEMKGKAVNIDTIEKTIKEEYLKIEDKVRNADYKKVKSGFQDMVDTFGKILSGIFKYLGKFIGVLLLFIAATTLLALLFGLLSWGSFEIMGVSDKFVHIPHFFDNSLLPKPLVTLFFFISIIIPFVFLFILGLNILSKEKKTLGLTANLSILGIWLVSLFGLGFAGIQHNTQFAKSASVSSNREISIASKDTLRIFMRNDDKIADRKSLYQSRHLENVLDSLGNEKLYSSNIYIDVRKGSSDKVMVKVIKSARAFNKKKARESAKLIDYNFDNKQGTLLLNSYFLTDTELKNNRPKIDVILYVPRNTYLTFDASSADFLHDIKNKQDIYDADMVEHLFYMDNTGLECIDCLNKSVEKQKENVNLKIDKNGVKRSIKE